MISLHERCVVDERGKRKAAVVPIAEWQRILGASEELEDIQAFDKAKAYPFDAFPFGQAVMELREGEGE